ncbi:hypothetical protein ACLMJK_007725 [Lecanora helva]
MSSTRILVLGSGMVAPPCIEYLLRNEKNTITVACRTLSTAQTLVRGRARAKAISLDVTSLAELESQIALHDLVISLVPYIYHVAVIKFAIKHKVNVVTTSYVSDAIRELDGPAKEAGIVVLNEVGVDPGVDHLYAIKKISEVHSKGGKIKEFYSYCGGLPAPEHANNPLGFKFSWSPRGALLSQYNSAHFLSGGEKIEISKQDLMGFAKPYFVLDGYNFVAYPNRNSVPFSDFYGIPEATTVIRGSLRYEGNPAFVKALIDLGWLDTQHKDWLQAGSSPSWAQVMQKAIDAKGSDEQSLIVRVKEICNFPTETESERIISGLRWIGLFSNTEATLRGGNLLDTLCAQLEKELSYRLGERDLVMLQHKFVVEWADGREETATSTLELYGDPNGYPAMAKSVDVTCMIATQLLLDRHRALNVPGVLAPYHEDICDPIRKLLEKEGINMVERVV